MVWWLCLGLSPLAIIFVIGSLFNFGNFSNDFLQADSFLSISCFPSNRAFLISKEFAFCEKLKNNLVSIWCHRLKLVVSSFPSCPPPSNFSVFNSPGFNLKKTLGLFLSQFLSYPSFPSGMMWLISLLSSNVSEMDLFEKCTSSTCSRFFVHYLRVSAEHISNHKERWHWSSLL